jgi:hypothetical protein
MNDNFCSLNGNEIIIDSHGMNHIKYELLISICKRMDMGLLLKMNPVLI